MKTLFLKYFAMVAITIAVANCSYAQTDTTKLRELEGLSLKDLLNLKVTTASKTSEELDKAPATAVVITKEQIKLRGYQSLLDVIYDLPDIKIDDKVYSGFRHFVTMRGTMGSDKFIILLDGVRISSPIDEALPVMENYPVNLAEQIEIIYGPASALYGANAVSGVINIITKKLSEKKQTGVSVTSMAGDNGYTNHTFFITQKLNTHISVVGSGQYYYDGQPDLSKVYADDSLLNVDSYSSGTLNTIYGPATPKKPITPAYEAPMSAYNIYLALHADDFSISWFRNSTTTPSAYGSNTSNALYNKDAFIKQGVGVTNASYKKSFGKLSTVTSLTASDFTLDPESNYRNLYTAGEPAYKYETATAIKGEEQLNFKVSEKLNLAGGASYESFSVVPYSADLGEPVNPDEDIHAYFLGTKNYYSPEGLAVRFYCLKYSNIGTYFQSQYSPSQKINFTLGARYDINSRYGNTFNPRLGIVYNPFEKTTVKLLYGSAFLAPSPATSYGYWGSFDTNDSGKTFHSYFLHLPNPDLKPITSQNAELSVRQYISNNFSVTVDGYYTSLTNLNSYANDNSSLRLYNNIFNGIPVDYIEVTINQARQTNYGGSIQLNWKYSGGRFQLNSYAGLSYVNGKLDDALEESDETGPDMELEFISPFIFKAGADIKYGKFTCSPRLTLMGKQNLSGIKDTIATILTRQTIAGYALLNLSLRYNITKKFSVFTNITNVLNQRYRSVGYNMTLNNQAGDLFPGQPGDPIRIMGGVNINF